MDNEFTLERQLQVLDKLKPLNNSKPLLMANQKLQIPLRAGFPQKGKQEYRPQQRVIIDVVAKDVTCKKCHKKGHFHAVCRTKVSCRN